MLDEKLKQALAQIGIQGIDDTTKNEDLPKILKQNKKVLKAHDDLATAVAEGPSENDDPSVAATTPPDGDGAEGDPEVAATTPPAKADDKKPAEKEKETNPSSDEPPKVPSSTATPVAAPVAAAPSKPRKFGNAFPDRK